MHRLRKIELVRDAVQALVLGGEESDREAATELPPVQWLAFGHDPARGGEKAAGGVARREGGRWSLEEMTEVKWVTIQMGKRQYPF